MGFLGDLFDAYIDSHDEDEIIEDAVALFGGGRNFDQKAWNKATKKIDKLLDKGDFEKALDTLVEYYNEYEDGEPDFHYYQIRANIFMQYYDILDEDDEDFDDVEEEIEENLVGMKDEAEEAEGSDRRKMMSIYEEYRKVYRNLRRSK